MDVEFDTVVLSFSLSFWPLETVLQRRMEARSWSLNVNGESKVLVRLQEVVLSKRNSHTLNLEHLSYHELLYVWFANDLIYHYGMVIFTYQIVNFDKIAITYSIPFSLKFINFLRVRTLLFLPL